jgi:hypothetical protein
MSAITIPYFRHYPQPHTEPRPADATVCRLPCSLALGYRFDGRGGEIGGWDRDDIAIYGPMSKRTRVRLIEWTTERDDPPRRDKLTCCSELFLGKPIQSTQLIVATPYVPCMALACIAERARFRTVGSATATYSERIGVTLDNFRNRMTKEFGRISPRYSCNILWRHATQLRPQEFL